MLSSLCFSSSSWHQSRFSKTLSRVFTCYTGPKEKLSFVSFELSGHYSLGMVFFFVLRSNVNGNATFQKTIGDDHEVNWLAMNSICEYCDAKSQSSCYVCLAFTKSDH